MPGSSSGAESAAEKPLSKSDWILLTAISLLTAFIVVCSVEGIARLLFTESKTTTLKCLVVNDPTTGVRAIPNTACSQKIYESGLITYKINSCGHRAGMECGRKPAETYRIVMIGSSFSYGMWVRQDQSFAALLPREIVKYTGRNVQLYNEAMQWGFPRSVTLRLNEVVAAEPDMILWPLTPMDIGSIDLTLPFVPAIQSDTYGQYGFWQHLASVIRSKSILELVRSAWDKISSRLNGERSVFLLQHYLFKSQSQYVRQTLMQNGPDNFLRDPLSERWQQNLMKFEQYFAEVQTQAKNIGAVVVVVMLPDRAQAAMLSMNEWPVGFNPYKLGNEVRSIVMRQGGTYVDISSEFRNIPNPEQFYLPVDGHPDANWHAMVSSMLAKALSDGSVAALRSPTGRQAKIALDK